eukprot:4183411-Karenia_brevis.AAC.2
MADIRGRSSFDRYMFRTQRDCLTLCYLGVRHVAAKYYDWPDQAFQKLCFRCDILLNDQVKNFTYEVSFGSLLCTWEKIVEDCDLKQRQQDDLRPWLLAERRCTYATAPSQFRKAMAHCMRSSVKEKLGDLCDVWEMAVKAAEQSERSFAKQSRSPWKCTLLGQPTALGLVKSAPNHWQPVERNGKVDWNRTSFAYEWSLEITDDSKQIHKVTCTLQQAHLRGVTQPPHFACYLKLLRETPRILEAAVQEATRRGPRSHEFRVDFVGQPRESTSDPRRLRDCLGSTVILLDDGQASEYMLSAQTGRTTWLCAPQTAWDLALSDRLTGILVERTIPPTLSLSAGLVLKSLAASRPADTDAILAIACFHAEDLRRNREPPYFMQTEVATARFWEYFSCLKISFFLALSPASSEYRRGREREREGERAREI